MRRLLLFDVDLTLIATGGAGLRNLWGAVHQVLGHDFSDIHVEPNGKTDPRILSEGLAQAGVPDTPDVHARVFAVYETFLREDLAQPDERRHVLPGVSVLLDRLAADPRFALALLTGNMERTGRLKLAAFDLNRYFPLGAWGSDHADRNQLGEIARRRAEQHYACSFAAGDTWVIGDTPFDVQAGQAMGARVMGVATGRTSMEALHHAGADVVVPNLADTERILHLLLADRPIRSL